MTFYTFGDVLRFNALPRNRLKRWTAAGIITPTLAAGGDTPRRFSFRDLVAAAIADDLRGLGVAEDGLRRTVQNLHGLWNQPDAPLDWRNPDGPKTRDAVVIWIAFQRHIHPDGGDEVENIATYPVTTDQLVSRVTDGQADGSGIAESGIAVPMARIIADLEQKTGDRFEWGTPPGTDTPAALRQELEHVQASLAAKFTEALTAALTAATGDAPLGDEKRAAIIRAVTAALAEKQP